MATVEQPDPANLDPYTEQPDPKSLDPYTPQSPPPPEWQTAKNLLSPQAYSWVQQNILDPGAYINRAIQRSSAQRWYDIAKPLSDTFRRHGIDDTVLPPQLPADEPKRGGWQGFAAHAAESMATPEGAALTGLMPLRSLATGAVGEGLRQAGASPAVQMGGAGLAGLAMGVPDYRAAGLFNPNAVSNFLARPMSRAGIGLTVDALGRHMGLEWPFSEMAGGAASAAAPYISRAIRPMLTLEGAAYPTAGAYMGTPSGITAGNLLTPGAPEYNLTTSSPP